ncbi:MAG: 50S ribosomal protein L24 [Verrucomicrobia bacterium]|nr:50S ribosomal protein L24 [Verrucomicrobiota bacterium]
MTNKWIRKGDKVVVIAGNEKGSVGSIRARDGDRVIIEGLNIRKKHVKPKQKMQPGIVEMESPMHISNVSICNEEGKPVKIKAKISKDGSKKLIYMEAGKEVLYRDLKKKKE